VGGVCCDNSLDMNEPHGVAEYASARTGELLTINELRQALRVSRATIYKLVNSGELRAVRVGERLRFRPEDVDRYLERDREPA
jgi:excisionase family DNA binding protein